MGFCILVLGGIIRGRFCLLRFFSFSSFFLLGDGQPILGKDFLKFVVLKVLCRWLICDEGFGI